mgnify:CR=1 FL=1|jgi:hypothetical protein
MLNELDAMRNEQNGMKPETMSTIIEEVKFQLAESESFVLLDRREAR